MKKLFGLLLTAAVLLLIISCGPTVVSGDLFDNVSGYGNTSNNIVITWEDSASLASEISSYTIYQCDVDGGNIDLLKTASISTGELELGRALYDFDLGNTYYFKLKAVVPSGYEVSDPWSEIFSVTLRSPSLYPKITSCFSHVTDSYDSVCLRWSVEADTVGEWDFYKNFDDIEIYRKTGDGDFSFLTSPISSANEYYDKTVVDGEPYTYKIRVTYEDTYTEAGEDYYESAEKTVTYDDTPNPAVTIDEPTLNSITVDTDVNYYACEVEFDCAKNNVTGTFGAELDFYNYNGGVTYLKSTGEFGNTSPVSLTVDSTYLDDGTYYVTARVYVEYGGSYTYSDEVTVYNVVIDTSLF